MVDEKLAIIKENNQKVYNAGKFKTLRKSEYMHPTVSGSAIRVDDVNSIEHKLGFRVRSKNLFNDSILLGYGFILDDGTYTGLASKISEKPIFNIDFKQNEQYTLSLKGYNTSVTGATILINFYYTDGTSQTGIRITGTTEMSHSFTSSAGKTLRSIIPTFYHNGEINIANIQLELGTEATPYTPYISDFSAVEVSRYGKNLLNISASSRTVKTLEKGNITPRSFDGKGVFLGIASNNNYAGTTTNAYPFSQIDDNTFVMGKKTSYAGYGIGFDIAVIPNTNYTFSANYSIEGVKEGFGFYDKEGNYISSAYEPNFITPTNCYWVVLVIIPPNNTTDIEVSNYQLELGTTATEYEPYISPQTAKATAEGVVEGLTSIAPTMTLLTDTNSVVINCKYYRDIDTYINNLNTNIALTGGN